MKIALIIHELQREGGGERQCVALARALSGQRHDVVIFTSAYDPDHCFPEICKDLNVKELGRGWFPSIRRPFLLRGYLDMARLSLLVNEGYDIWNPHHWPAQWGAVWLKKKLGGLVVWMCNDVPDFRQKASQFRPLSNALQVPLRWLYYLIDCVQNRNVDLTLFLSKWAEKEFQAIY